LQKLDDQEIFQKNKTFKALGKQILICSHLSAILLLFVLYVLKFDNKILDGMLALMILSILIGSSTGGMFLNWARITKAEIKYREFKDKQNT
jgi:hypothetical protein